MRIAIHTKNSSPELEEGRQALVAALANRGVDVIENWDNQSHIDILISIGGDGTLLSAVHRIGPRGIPVVGINFGHLGFLTTAGRDDIDLLADSLIEHRYSTEKRSLLQVSTGDTTLFALNEVYLHRGELAPLLHTQVQVDAYNIATYAADGLIVATPTGSTAYSLSCGGPILAPDSRSLVITPIAAHTLTLRPLVVSDSSAIRLSHNDDQMVCTLGADSFVTTLSGRWQVEIKKADYDINLLRLEQQNFYTAIRNKLMWGR
ncbi:MAG: NAD(+)/NADH kinase [Bacteroidales bacterium]|nr:NAD(+)/NADH kinase [Bacteroidales bacterium]